MRILDFYSFRMIRKSLYYASNLMDVSMLKEEYKPAISLLNIILKKRLTGDFRFRKQERWLQIMILKLILINMHIY
ncbi:hypothetical protein AM232_11690 [Bacillus sp. FJAT-21352]|nr:hypothetical protein AM232_11690 [Bacillus sp. FJAT-21352]